MPNPIDWLRKRLGKADTPATAPESAPRPPRRSAPRIGPDRFPLPGDHPLRNEHLRLDAFLDEYAGTRRTYGRRLATFGRGAPLDAAQGDEGARLLAAFGQRWKQICRALDVDRITPNYVDLTRRRDGAWIVRETLIRRKLPLTDAHLAEVVSAQADPLCPYDLVSCGHLVNVLERRFAEGDVPEALRQLVAAYRKAFGRFRNDVRDRKLTARLDALLGAELSVSLDEKQAWVRTLRADLDAATDAGRRAWTELLAHAQTASAGKPSKKWAKTAATLRAPLGDDDVEAALVRWLGEVETPAPGNRGHGLDADISQDTLKGLCWVAGGLPGDRPALARALGALTFASVRSLPGVGIRAPRVANAAIYALGGLTGHAALAQLALLKVRIRYRTALNSIEKALTRAAEREGLPKSELEEMAVPSYGLTEVGVLTEPLGEFTAELRVAGTTKTTLTWSRTLANGKRKTQKSVPAAVKRDHPDELKALKGAAKDIQKMLPAQRDRIDNLFLARREWPFATWRERYLDHPLVGTLARRIIWSVERDGASTAVCWADGRLVTVDDMALGDVPDDAVARLWHPIDADTEAALAWREWLERHGVVQPFKQAHREIYLLTDAERNTGIYSNRFAAHVLKQHQFNALCAVRGWQNRLRLMVDDEYPPATRDLPEWGVRAEFWIEGIGDDYGVDTNDNGTYLRVVTDQVRFYPINAAVRTAHAGGGGYATHGLEGSDTPLPLEDVPPLVLSEILRDVDLFVGVASVGNDPTWRDGGPRGRYVDYWNSYSFGELSGTARTRKAILERLIPRLKIAKVCTVTDRFLEVRGTIRGYRIHLGSGNILMTPNDQYLCIVPGRGAVGGPAGKVMLPFEGDRMLSIILSKAFLLAADDKIKDRTILSQIGV